jgi:hypothetical protein
VKKGAKRGSKACTSREQTKYNQGTKNIIFTFYSRELVISTKRTEKNAFR